MPDGSTQNLSARSVADATGPWANKTSRFWSGKEEKKVRPTRGSHIVVPRVLTEYAVLVMAPKEKRILFVIPWRGCTLVGTTDVDDDGEPDKVRCSEEETEYLLHHASRLFPQMDWSKSQVQASFAGLRPLAWSSSKQASSVSREDHVSIQGRVVSIVGGKLTTCRSMARKALKQVYAILGRAGDPPPETRLPGAPFEPWNSFLERARKEWPTTYHIPEETALYLAQLYGNRAVPLLEPTRIHKDLTAPLYIGRPEIAAQVPYAIQREDARHLDDILLRRLEIGFGPGRREAAEPVSRLAAEILGWDEPTRIAEVKRYLDHLES
jgi:glycerol-3-phosphate dehydrogenase